MQVLTIKGKVVKGKGRGKTLGFPTINFLTKNKLSVDYGVYAGIIQFQDVKYPAAIHYGPKPVFKEEDVTLEAYLLTEITKVPNEGIIVLIKKIRDVQDFPNPQKMVNQITEDVKEIREELIPLFPKVRNESQSS